MRRLAKAFPVVITPEAYTSKTCFDCDGWKSAVASEKIKRQVKEKDGRLKKTEDGREVTREVRGLRVCNNEDCSTEFLNRDRNASLNFASDTVSS